MRYVLLSCILYLPLTSFFAPLFSKTIYIIPFEGASDQRPAAYFDPYSSRDEIARPFCELRQRLVRNGYTVRFTNTAEQLTDFSALICFNQYPSGTLLRNLRRYPRERCLLFVFEPPVVTQVPYQPQLTEYFGKIFVMLDNLVDNRHYFKFHFPQPQIQMLPDVPPFHAKKFCVMIAGNKGSAHPDSLYQERQKVVTFFANKPSHEFELYGAPRWDSPQYKGTIPSKWNVLKQFKFAFCYENMHNQLGYITEKMWDALHSGCIPICWGPDNLTSYIPADCFIDRRLFASNEELYTYLHSITETQYNTYLEAIRHFLRSPAAQKFSTNTFVNLILSHIPSS